MKSGFLAAPRQQAAARGKRIISDWLDVVKEGYGARFASAFEEVGVEDTNDLAELDSEDALVVLEQLLQAAGAKTVQLQKIRRALADEAAASKSTGAQTTTMPFSAQPELANGPKVVPTGTAVNAGGYLGAAAAERTNVAPKDSALWRAAFGDKLPNKPSVIPRPESVSPPSACGYTVLKSGNGPRLYFVHSIDGEIFLAGATFAALPSHLGNCRCVALEYNEDARMCNTVPALCSLYVRRILQDAQRCQDECLHIVAYSFGCILAHQMALQLEDAGVKVLLVLVGSEVAWPADAPPSRMGGYPWLGGALESALLVARSCGALEFAEQEAQGMLESRPEERDANRLHMRTYWKHAGPSDMPYEDFVHTVTTGARNMDLLHSMLCGYVPAGTFHGQALLLLAPESPDFEAAQEVNKKFCANLRVEFALGSHYNMLHTRQAHVAAQVMVKFLKDQGASIVASPSPAMLSTQSLGLPSLVSAAAPSQLEPTGVAADLPARVLCILSEQVTEPLELTSNLMDVGLDSISMSLVATQLQQELGVQLTAGKMMELASVGDLVAHIRRLLPQPTSTSSAPTTVHPPANSSPETPGLVTLQHGDGPRVYMVHGIDGDMFNSGASYSAVAPMLAPCHGAALLYDDEAYRCDSLPALAAVYSRRVIADASRHPQCSIFVAGYSFGCVIAHQMAMQLQAKGVKPYLLLIDFEVTYPPGGSLQRIGGYAWLGGDIEGTLLMARSMLGWDGIQWASREAELLLKQTPRERDAKALRIRAHEAIASKRKGFQMRDLETFCDRGGRNMERIHTITGKWAPPGTFQGETLLILAPESVEFHAAKDINGKYCSRMEVVHALGTHYSILQAELAPKAAGCILNFMRNLGLSVPEAPSIPDVPGLATLRNGDGPRVYMVHGIDGDIYSVGASYAALAPMLAPCNASAFAYDEEALKCDSVPALASLYMWRMFQDRHRNPSVPLFIAGYSFGCVIAHAMALQAQEYGLDVSLILIDFEVTYPAGGSVARLGGYDWLGGSIEATLLVSRSMGMEGIQWAALETEALLKQSPETRDVQAFQQRTYEHIASKRRGFRKEEFQVICDRGGKNMERINTITGKFAPSRTFTGETLLVLAPDSAEFHAAKDVNAKYCSTMEVMYAFGTHYSILQAALAPKAAGCILSFMRRLGNSVPDDPIVPDVPGTVTLQSGEGPRVYMVHGIDGSAFGAGASFASLAPMLVPCNSCALVYDDEALKCDSLPALAGLYCARMYQDMQRSLSAPLVLVGYSFGCVIAHQMAVQLQELGANINLILVDFEVSYPPGGAVDRAGGYDWLGGDIEAALLMARSMHGTDWATSETEKLLKQPARERDAKELQQRAFEAIASQRHGFPRADFDRLCHRGALNMQRMHSITGHWVPSGTFKGAALLVLASESKEFHTAKEVNAQYCTLMDTAEAGGTHYNILQAEQASSAAEVVLAFLRKQGHPVLARSGVE